MEKTDKVSAGKGRVVMQTFGVKWNGAYALEGLVKIESQSSGPGDKLNNEDVCKGCGKMCVPS